MGTFRTITACIGVSLILFCLGCGVVAIPIGGSASPSISQVYPQTIAAGTQGTTLKVMGSNFDSAAVIQWNGNALPTSVVDANTLAASVQSSDLASPSVVALTVHNKQTGQSSNSVPVTVAPGNSGNHGHALAISTTSLPSGTAGAAYSAGLAATGGSPAYTWSITSGQLPGGMTLDVASGVISGTPTASGTYNFMAKVTDSSSPAQTASAALTLTVAAAAQTIAPLQITSPSLPAGTEGTAYSAGLAATGGTLSYTWTITSGRLPLGLSLGSANGAISGTPTVSGTYSFTAAVSDSSSPAQTVSVPLTMTIAAAAPAQTGSPSLTITTATLPSGTDGVAYSTVLQASGGTPSYVWSVTAGNLPSGLTMSATTGAISGTPSASGTFNFTVAVADNSNPAQKQSLATSISVMAVTATPTGPGTTWYIRPDGGTRYDANVPTGQCDGKGDAPYPGSGVNQHCAFKDYRYLWDDQTYGNDAWVIAGGDTVIIRGGPWRVGWDSTSGPGAGYTWCYGGSGSFACTNPTIPAGTATQHTRILGENYASCSNGNVTDRSKLTQIFGGFGVTVALNLRGAQYVDVECLDITRHSQCIMHGVPAYPVGCSASAPVDDYDSEGIMTDVNTHDLLMQDLWIHGHTDRGIIGAIGGVVTCLRCDIAYNGMAGWDFDDGSGSHNGFGTASVNGVWNFKYSTIEWNGCNQEYPMTDAVPVISCYSQSSGGYGDGVGTPPGMCLTANIDHSAFNYNTQDGLDLGHIDTGTCSVTITNSVAIGNNGQTFKWGPNLNPAIFENNLAMANCLRMSQPMPGAPSTYNAHLGDFCRAGDAISFDFRQGGSVLLANNTVVTYQPTTFDTQCWDAPNSVGTGTSGAGCANATLTARNNIVLGYDNPTSYPFGGQAGGPGLFYYRDTIGNIVRSNNIYFGLGHGACSSLFPSEYCEDPLLINEPAWSTESALDNFNFDISSGSPAKGAGVAVPGLTLDYTGQVRGNPPSIGAYEQ